MKLSILSLVWNFYNFNCINYLRDFDFENLTTIKFKTLRHSQTTQFKVSNFKKFDSSQTFIHIDEENEKQMLL